jgi:hypothetical protein
MIKKENSRPDLLQECLEALDTEGETIESVLSRFPERADQLRPALLAAQWLRERRPALAPRPGFVSARPAWLFCQMRKGQSGSKLDLRPAQPFSWRRLIWRTFLFGMLFAAGFLVASLSIEASQTWLPGDPPYPLKSAQENLALILATSPAKKASLHTEYASRRLLEAQALAFEGRYDQLPATVANFSFQVEAALKASEMTAEINPARGVILATQLERVLRGQSGLVALLAGATPEPGCAEFHRMLDVSQNGLDVLQGLLQPQGQGI